MDRFSPEALAMNGDVDAEEYLRLSDAQPEHGKRPRQTPLARQRIREAMTEWHRKNRQRKPSC